MGLSSALGTTISCAGTLQKTTIGRILRIRYISGRSSRLPVPSVLKAAETPDPMWPTRELFPAGLLVYALGMAGGLLGQTSKKQSAWISGLLCSLSLTRPLLWF